MYKSMSYNKSRVLIKDLFRIQTLNFNISWRYIFKHKTDQVRIFQYMDNNI